MFPKQIPPITNPTEYNSRQPSVARQPGFAEGSPNFLKEVLTMHRHVWMVLAVLAVLAFLPVFAGGDHHSKCTYGTQECLDHMANKLKNSGWVGVELDTENQEGYLVNKVIAGSPAEAAGLQSGDILVALNGVGLKKENDEAMSKARKEWKPGQVVSYTVKRGSSSKEVSVTLGAWPADALARVIGEHMLEHAGSEIAAAK
jgi:membrane-associated protease RseP (regulator of RpoE activity)